MIYDVCWLVWGKRKGKTGSYCVSIISKTTVTSQHRTNIITQNILLPYNQKKCSFHLNKIQIYNQNPECWQWGAVIHCGAPVNQGWKSTLRHLVSSEVCHNSIFDERLTSETLTDDDTLFCWLLRRDATQLTKNSHHRGFGPLSWGDTALSECGQTVWRGTILGLDSTAAGSCPGMGKQRAEGLQQGRLAF